MFDFLLMASEKLKEAREWLTFGLSFLTMLAIPIGLLILNNQKMVIEREIEEKYVNKETFNQMRSTWDSGLGELRGSINAMLIQQAHLQDAQESLKEKLDRGTH